MIDIVIGTFIGAIAGTISGNLLFGDYKKRQTAKMLSNLKDLSSPTYFQDKYGDSGIKYDKLMDRAIIIRKQAFLK